MSGQRVKLREFPGLRLLLAHFASRQWGEDTITRAQLRAAEQIQANADNLELQTQAGGHLAVFRPAQARRGYGVRYPFLFNKRVRFGALGVKAVAQSGFEAGKKGVRGREKRCQVPFRSKEKSGRIPSWGAREKVPDTFFDLTPFSMPTRGHVPRTPDATAPRQSAADPPDPLVLPGQAPAGPPACVRPATPAPAK